MCGAITMVDVLVVASSAKMGTKAIDNLDKVYKLKKQYLLKYCLVWFARHGHALTGESPEHA